MAGGVDVSRWAPGGNVRFEDVAPVRGFRWNKGDRSFPGWYYAVTTGGHVGYRKAQL